MEDGKSRLQKTQEDVEEVRVIMLDNLNKTDERGDKLRDLDDRADELLNMMNEASWSPWSKAFEKKSVKIKQKKMWENKKFKIVLISGAVLVAVIILAVIIYASIPN